MQERERYGWKARWRNFFARDSQPFNSPSRLRLEILADSRRPASAPLQAFDRLRSVSPSVAAGFIVRFLFPEAFNRASPLRSARTKLASEPNDKHTSRQGIFILI